MVLRGLKTYKEGKNTYEGWCPAKTAAGGKMSTQTKMIPNLNQHNLKLNRVTLALMHQAISKPATKMTKYLQQLKCNVKHMDRQAD